jgi:PAS domain S-box-containing protein
LNYETSESVIEPTVDFKAAFEAMPGISALLQADSSRFTILAVTDEYVQLTGVKREDLVGKGLFEMFPKSPDDPDFTGERNMRASFQYIISHKLPHQLPVQRYDIPNPDGTFSERYWYASNKPVLDAQGRVLYIIHSATEITEQIKAERRETAIREIEKSYQLFMQAPVIIGIVSGDDYVIELANDELLEIWDRTREVVGKPLLRAIPELEEQGFKSLLDQVRTTGEPFHANESPIVLLRNGKEEIRYLNFIYKPYYSQECPTDSVATGVFAVGHDVTEQVLTRQKARENEEELKRFKYMADHAQNSFFLIRRDGSFAYLNQKAISALGYTEAEIGQLRVPDFFPTQNAATFPTTFDQVQEKKQIRFETFYRSKEAFVFPIEINMGHMVYNGEPYMFAITRDITEQKELERSIRESENKLRSIIDQAPNPILIFKGMDMTLEIANKALFDLWKVDESSLGKTFLEILPEMKGQGFLDLLQKVYHTGEAFHGYEMPAEFEEANGQRRTVYFNFTYHPYREDDTITGVLVLATDVTGQVLAKRKIKESEEELKQFKYMADHAEDPFILMRADGTFAYLNVKALEAWGYTQEEAKDLRVPDVDPIFQDEAFNAVFAQAQKETIPQFETLHKRKDGHIYPVEVNMGGLTLDGKPHLFAIARGITERKKAEKAINETNERFELVAKATQDAIWDWNLITDEIWWNEGFKTLFLYKQEDIEPGIESWYNRLHPEDKERVMKDIHDVIDTGGKQWSSEYRFRKADGSYAIVFDRGYALHNEDGKPFRMLGSMIDITQRKKLEEAAVESERTLRNMILQSPVAMCILRGPSLVVEIANKRILEIWGKTAEQVLEIPIFEGSPEIRNQGLEELLQQVYTTGESFIANERPVMLLRNGTLETTYLNFVYDPLREVDGIITGVMVVANEVTEQVKARKKMEEQNSELEFVLDFMPQMVWHTLADGTADFFNQVYLDYTGLSLSQLIGKGWLRILHPDDSHRTEKTWQEAINGGISYEVEHRIRRHDGAYRWFLTRGIPLKNENGAVEKWYGTTTDIQEHKTTAELLENRVEERTRELLEANNNLRRINAELEQFTYVSHHDLQEPLRKIQIFTEMVRSDRQNKFTETSQQRLERITAAAQRMSTALSDVLNFASLNKEEQPATVNLEEVLATVQADLELVIAEKKATVTVESMPAIRAVPRQMHQLFYNLVNNALKFSKPEVPPVISVTGRALPRQLIVEQPDLDTSKHYYEITVKDNGIGFEPDYANKIFLMFQRLHNKDAYSGTGIGLALARKVVLKNGGKIWAESSVGKGATFKVLLPAD